MTKISVTTACNADARLGVDSHRANMPRDGNWLMLVRTRCTDVAKEDKFNDWYDNIDIPDVLEVPGYVRARRGLLQADSSQSDDEGGKYVALYDIKSDAIDKTIIEMLMATRKMEQRGRSTDLLEVTERAYYRQYATSCEASMAPPSAGSAYLFLERFDTPQQDPEAEFADWYNRSYRHLVDNGIGIVRATRYELYRVLMIQPKMLPLFLTVYEITAQSAESARLPVGIISDGWRSVGPHSAYLPGDTALFRMIREQVR